MFTIIVCILLLIAILVTILPALIYPARVPIIADYYYGIFQGSHISLVVDAMISAWIAVLVTCLTVYSLTRSFVWSRRKTLLISVLTIGGSVSLTLVSWFYQVTSDMLGFNLTDASFIFYGYPFAWFRASWGAFRLPNWEYDIQPYGLAGNVVFYMWLIFGILLVGMVLYKRIRSRASSSTA